MARGKQQAAPEDGLRPDEAMEWVAERDGARRRDEAMRRHADMRARRDELADVLAERRWN